MIVAMIDGGYPAEFRAAAAIVVWGAVIVGLALGFWPRSAIPGTALAAGMCLVGLAALTALSMAWASDDGRAFAEIVRVLGYLGLFVAVVLASPSASARPWLIGLALGLTGVLLLALGTRMLPSLLSDDELVAAIPGSRVRLSYPVGYWNGLGACAALMAILLAWLGVAARGRGARALATAAIALPLLAMELTQSRGGLGALVLGLGILIAMGPRRPSLAAVLALGGAGGIALALLGGLTPEVTRPPEAAVPQGEGLVLLASAVLVMAAVASLRWRLDQRIQSLTFSYRPSPRARRVGIAAAAILAVAVLAGANVPDRLSSFGASSDAPGDARPDPLSSSGRYQFWEAGINAFASEPVTGLGAGGYEAWWGEHASLPVFIRDGHSLLVETLAELGVAGLLLIGGFLAIAAVAGVRGRVRDPLNPARGAALAILGAGLFAASIDWMWELPAVFVPVVVAAALLTGPALGPAPDPRERRRGFGVAAVLVGWLAILTAAASLVTEVKLDESRSAVDAERLDEAVEDARNAGAMQPWAAEPYLQEAQVEELRGNLPAAETALSEAVDRAPNDWRVWVVAARLDAATGDLRGSLKATARSNDLRAEVPPPPASEDES